MGENVPLFVRIVTILGRILNREGAEVGGWRLEVGGWRLEVGGWRLEVGELGDDWDDWDGWMDGGQMSDVGDPRIGG